MLYKAAPEGAVDAAVHAYLHETLGIAPKLRAWPGAGKLPYFLQDTFEVRELKLLDRQMLLAINKRPEKQGLANVRGQMDKLRQLAGMPVVYVTGALASYERKRLIEQKVPFLSAILLDDAYYDFILAGRREVDGLPWVGEDRLIPLKASAWLDLGGSQPSVFPAERFMTKPARVKPLVAWFMPPTAVAEVSLQVTEERDRES